MFRKLHFKLTLLSGAITSIIMAVMSVCFLFVSENSQLENSFLSFRGEMNTFLSNLSETDVLSHTWLKRIQGEQYVIRMFDNGSPLQFNEISTDKTVSDIFDQIYGYYETNFPEKGTINSHKSFHTEFSIYADEETFEIASLKQSNYFVSCISILKNKSPLTVFILSSQRPLRDSLMRQRFFLFLLILSAAALLTIFCYLFTGKLLSPIQKNQENQIHFIASASHELRTPLSVILSSAAACEIAPSENNHYFSRISGKKGSGCRNYCRNCCFWPGENKMIPSPAENR